MSESWSPHPVRDPEFAVSQRVRVKDTKLVRSIRERYQDPLDGEWFYLLDQRNYLHEAMLEAAE